MKIAPSPRPVTVTLVDDHPVIVQGVTRMLEGHPELAVVDPHRGGHSHAGVDVVLFDAVAAQERGAGDVAQLLRDTRCPKVVVYTWTMSADRVKRALALGAHGYLSKELGAQKLASALLRIHRGERVVDPDPECSGIQLPDWPGRGAGLSPREAEVVALITQGATNEDIARACHLSINSVKSYIRSAYRKMGVQRRSQAVLWGVRHGMQPVEPMLEREPVS